MDVAVIYSGEALHQLKRLNRTLARRIVQKIAENASQADPLQRAKVLHGKLSGKHRYRIGDYRAIFTMDDKGNVVVLTVLAIKHRKDIYR